MDEGTSPKSLALLGRRSHLSLEVAKKLHGLPTAISQSPEGREESADEEVRHAGMAETEKAGDTT